MGYLEFKKYAYTQSPVGSPRTGVSAGDTHAHAVADAYKNIVIPDVTPPKDTLVLNMPETQTQPVSTPTTQRIAGGTQKAQNTPAQNYEHLPTRSAAARDNRFDAFGVNGVELANPGFKAGYEASSAPLKINKNFFGPTFARAQDKDAYLKWFTKQHIRPIAGYSYAHPEEFGYINGLRDALSVQQVREAIAPVLQNSDPAFRQYIEKEIANTKSDFGKQWAEMSPELQQWFMAQLPSGQPAGTQTTTAPSNNTTAPAEQIEEPPIIPEPQRQVTAKDIFTADRIKTYKDFLALDPDKRLDFIADEANAPLVQDLVEYFGIGNDNPEFFYTRLKAALDSSDPSIVALGNELMKIMDGATENTENADGLLSMVKDMFAKLDENQKAELKSSFQTKMWDAVKTNPFEYLPTVASIFLRSIGLGGVADFAENPWIFYLGSAAILFGGGALLANMLSGDEEEPPFMAVGQPDPRMSRVPYSV